MWRVMNREKSTLEVFDFDWTLFRSPIPASITAIKTFLHSPESLEPPHVPWTPGGDFWIDRTVLEFKRSQQNKNSITILLTARRAKTGDRILDLIQKKGLRPDYAFFRSASYHKDKDRVYFKRKTISEFLDRHPTISKIIIWEDEPEQLESFQDLARRRRIKFEGHLIREPRSPFAGITWQA